MDIKKCKAYELRDRQELPELNSTGWLLEHKKTKARLVLMENADDNKVFSIGFRTPPKDSTGVAHIVEHTVLCGSKEFPLKDPFIELAKGSLNTFLNAMTYPDKTVYPVASCNAKDFQNLMHVYLDAVFYPNIYKEEKIFRQEGWHYELESPEAPLTYNGVVYNEMKGVFSSPDQLLYRDIQHSLFPDTAYGVESGGDPDAIPDLTYEAYLDFHRRYYHPSNSYIYLYGDMDMEEKLNWLDEKYLSHFDYLQVDSQIRLQEPFDGMQEKYGFYAATEGEETEGKAYFSYNVLAGESLDRELYRTLRVLDHVLVESEGAPLKQALLDAGIGSEIKSTYEGSIRQMYFSIIAKNVRMEQKQEFLDIIRRTLEELVRDGLNERSVLAAVNAMEFQYREADYGAYPKGLMYGLQIFDSWLYDDAKPFIHIHAGDLFDFLKGQVGTGYYEEVIKKYFLENPHTTFVSVQPKVGLTARMDQEEAQRLEQYRASLTDQEKEELVRETAELKAYQEEPDDPEKLKCIPVLAREDITRETREFRNEERTMAGLPSLHHNIFTNGISYIRLSFDILDLKEYAPYLVLLADLLGYVDTDAHDKLELGNEILLHAGGTSFTTATYERRDGEEFSMRLEAEAKVLYPETGKILELFGEIMGTSHLEDGKRLQEVIGELRSYKLMSLQAAGHNTAAWRAMSYLRERYYYVQQMKGISYYDFLCDLEEHFDERREGLVRVLQSLARCIFTKERLQISVTADGEGYSALEKEIPQLLNQLPEHVDVSIPEPDWRLPAAEINEGFRTAGKVQYVARAGQFGDKGIPYSGVYKVVRTILGYDYLWNEVRVKGGAYGVRCAFLDSGIGFITSYRDPNLEATDRVYQGIPEYLRNYDADERDMMKYIIGTISDLDIPLTPRDWGDRSYAAYMTGTTQADKQKERDEILAADPEKIRRAAAMVEAVLSDGRICALGSEEKIGQSGNLFEHIKTLK